MNAEDQDLFGMPVPEGRKPRCGRTRALAVLDHLLSMQHNQAKLHEELQKKFDSDAVGFFKTFVMPLLPKETKVAVEHDGIFAWRNLLGQEVKAADKAGAVGSAGTDGG